MIKPTIPQEALKQNNNGQKIKRDPTGRIPVESWRPSKKFSAWIRAYKIVPLGAKIGVERITIYKWLNGDRPPNRDNAMALADLSKQCPGEIGALTLDDILGKAGGP